MVWDWTAVIIAVGTEPSGAIGANHAALLFSNPERPLFRLCRPGVGICKSRFGLEGDDQRLRRHGRRHRPQAPGKFRMAHGAAGRGQGARVPDPYYIRNLRIGAGPNPRWAAAAS